MKPTNSSINASSHINIYLIGNNPIELGVIYDKLKSIKKYTYKAEIGFDLNNIFKKIAKFNPACILIDDNMEKLSLQRLIKRLGNHNSTRNIPITVLKNSNYQEAIVKNAQEYVLKASLTSESLSRTILSSIKLKKMQAYLSKTYRKSKTQFMGFLHND